MKDDRRPGDDRPRRIRARGGRAEVVHVVAGTGVRVVRDEATGAVYLVAADDIRRKSARIYTDCDGTRLQDLRERVDTILEHHGEDLSEDGRCFTYTVTEYDLDDRGLPASRVIGRRRVDAAAPGEDFAYAIESLVDEWVEPQMG